jgi:hypothetical protein
MNTVTTTEAATDAPAPFDPTVRFLNCRIGALGFTWERHSEFMTYSFLAAGGGPLFDLTPFAQAALWIGALPGRVIAGLLAGQGIGLGINLGVEASELLLPSEAMDWLAQTLDEAPEEAEGRPETFYPPKGLPESLLSALDAKLARAGGLAQGALLASVTYQGGRRGHLLAFVGAKAAAQEALARAVSEALVFSGVEAGEMDVVFLAPEDAATAAMARVALRFDLAQPEAPVKPAPTAPGMDPNRPPRLI